jgi:hypothetical protein
MGEEVELGAATDRGDAAAYHFSHCLRGTPKILVVVVHATG